MQSDTFINETDSDDDDYTSDSSEDLPKNNNIGQYYKFPRDSIKDERFIDQTSIETYEKVRRELFSKPIVHARLYIDSSNYSSLSDNFNSSNYVATFSTIKSVIGISLKKATIRVPQYNINNTNNKIIFHKEGDIDTKYTITINPGYYTVTELASAFSTTSSTDSHHVEYSSGAGTLTVSYYSSDSTVDSGKTGMIFKVVHSSDNIKFEWNSNNITRGSARLLGFYPITSSEYSITHYSDKPPDISQNHVDLCIPEIPDISCKRTISNGGEKNIIDRIPLSYSTGSYQYYEPDNFAINYFTPIKLDKFNILLFSDNNEVFDSQNTDNSFEFELTILVGRGS
jgi:hypothetical protein